MTGGATNRHRGDYFERQTRDALAAYGWVIIRAAGSMGPADLVALRRGNRPLFVSCKLSGRIDPGERRDLLKAAEQAGARGVVAMRPRPGYVEVRSVHLRPGFSVIDSLHVPPRERGRNAKQEESEKEP